MMSTSIFATVYFRDLVFDTDPISAIAGVLGALDSPSSAGATETRTPRAHLARWIPAFVGMTVP
jgi:hypothetical protein